MTSVDDVRKLLAEAEALAPGLDCCVEELTVYAEPLVDKANAMLYSDVSCPEALLLAALILRLRERMKAWEGQIA